MTVLKETVIRLFQKLDVLSDVVFPLHSNSAGFTHLRRQRAVYGECGQRGGELLRGVFVYQKPGHTIFNDGRDVRVSC